MQRIRYNALAFGAICALAFAASLAATAANATPNITGAIVKTRVFNDCPISTVTFTNNYPSSISIDDEGIVCFGFANLHIWHLADFSQPRPDSVFENASCFDFSADMVLDGSGNGEGGLQMGPWFALDTDGLFNCRTTDGEIACFGGRLPFYSFTAAFGLHYAKGTPIHLEMILTPNDVSLTNPATLEYRLVYLGTPYSSGPLALDQGNPSEDPPHGQWGILNNASLGGAYKAFLNNGNLVGLAATWSNIHYEGCTKPVPVKNPTWGQVKSLYK